MGPEKPGVPRGHGLSTFHYELGPLPLLFLPRPRPMARPEVKPDSGSLGSCGKLWTLHLLWVEGLGARDTGQGLFLGPPPRFWLPAYPGDVASGEEEGQQGPPLLGRICHPDGTFGLLKGDQAPIT